MVYAFAYIADAIGAFTPRRERLRDLQGKRRLAAGFGRLQRSRARSRPLVLTGPERLIHLSEFATRTTGRDEDRPGRLLLGRFPESGLSVA
jgi:hypothetical protein